MVSGLWGKKLGMTQVFEQNKSVAPVTVIDGSHWFIVDIKTQEKDGANAVRVGLVRSKYQDKPFEEQWLKALKKYFSHVREIKLNKPLEGIVSGQQAPFADLFVDGEKVDVIGVSKGRGFTGVVKRHGFTGGRSSHGSMFHRRPGSIGHMRTRGRVIKGKKLPGHMGVQRCTVKNLTVVSTDQEKHIVLIKGAVPGSIGTPVFVRKK